MSCVLLTLPYEIYFDLITQHLTGTQVITLMHINHEFRDVIGQDELLWRSLYQRDFSMIRVPTYNYQAHYIGISKQLHRQTQARVLDIAVEQGLEKVLEWGGYQLCNYTHVIEAIQMGHLDILIKIEKVGLMPDNMIRSTRPSHLNEAITKGHFHIVEYILSCSREYTFFAVELALAKGQYDIAEKLLIANAIAIDALTVKLYLRIDHNKVPFDAIKYPSIAKHLTK
jgi:hypothetical protein